MPKNEDGMRYPSIDDLLSKMKSKYQIAYASAKVAKIIEGYDIDIPNSKCVKPVGKALEEIIADRVKIEFKK